MCAACQVRAVHANAMHACFADVKEATLAVARHELLVYRQVLQIIISKYGQHGSPAQLSAQRHLWALCHYC
jgi:hypothetical protein